MINFVMSLPSASGSFICERLFDNDSWNRDDEDNNDSWSEREIKRATRDCHVRLSSDEIAKGDVRSFEPTGEIPGALLRYTKLGDEQFLKAGFRLDRSAGPPGQFPGWANRAGTACLQPDSP